MPKLLEMGFETEQRMIGAPSVLFGIVPYLSPFLFPVDCNYHRIYIENQGGSPCWKIKQMGSEAVVQSDQPADYFGRQAFQESAQSGLVREMFQPQHFQKSSVVLQDFGLVDSPKSHNDGKNQSQNQFGGMVIGTSLEGPNIFLEQMTKSELVAKTLNQPHPTEVGEVGFVEGKMNFSGTFWHVSQSTFLRRFLTRDLFDHYYSIFSLAIHAFSWRNFSRFTHF